MPVLQLADYLKRLGEARRKVALQVEGIQSIIEIINTKVIESNPNCEEKIGKDIEIFVDLLKRVNTKNYVDFIREINYMNDVINNYYMLNLNALSGYCNNYFEMKRVARKTFEEKPVEINGMLKLRILR